MPLHGIQGPSVSDAQLPCHNLCLQHSFVMESVLHACTPCTCSALQTSWKFPISSLWPAHAVSSALLVAFLPLTIWRILSFKDFWCVAPFKVPALTPLGQTPLEPQSPIFLAPGASFVWMTNFSMDLIGEGGRWFQDDSSTLTFIVLMIIYICSYSPELASLLQLYIISLGIRFSQEECAN